MRRWIITLASMADIDKLRHEATIAWASRFAPVVHVDATAEEALCLSELEYVVGVRVSALDCWLT